MDYGTRTVVIYDAVTCGRKQPHKAWQSYWKLNLPAPPGPNCRRGNGDAPGAAPPVARLSDRRMSAAPPPQLPPRAAAAAAAVTPADAAEMCAEREGAWGGAEAGGVQRKAPPEAPAGAPKVPLELPGAPAAAWDQ